MRCPRISEENLNEKKRSLAVKVHRVGNNTMVAICDAECFGMVLSGSNSVKISIRQPFFGDDPIDEDDLINYLKIATCYNFVGNQSVEFALEKGIGNRESVMYFDGIPYLMVMRL